MIKLHTESAQKLAQVLQFCFDFGCRLYGFSDLIAQHLLETFTEALHAGLDGLLVFC